MVDIGQLFAGLNIGSDEPMQDDVMPAFREALESVTSDSIWRHLAQDAPSIPQFCLEHMKEAGTEAFEAARIFLAALAIPGSTQYGIFDSELFHEAIRLMKGDVDSAVLTAMLRSLVKVFEAIQFTEYPDEREYLIDAICDVVAASSAIPCNLALECLGSLLNPEHGDVSEMTDTILQTLVPILLGLPRRHRATAGSSQRAAALAFVCNMLPDTQEDTAAILIQQVCVRVPDKQESRSIAANIVSSVLSVTHPSATRRFTSFLEKFASNAKMSYRAVAVDVAAHVAGSTDAGTASRLVKLVLKRLSDRAVTVRTRALGGIATLSKLPQDNTAGAAIRSVLGLDSEMGTKELDSVLVRVDDDRPMVRRAAVAALDALLFAASTEYVRAQLVAVLAQSCRDAALSARKQALSSLSRLMEASLSSSIPAYIRDAWLSHCLPLVADPEPSIVDKVIDAIHTVVIAPIGRNDVTVWELLAAADDDAIKYIGRAAVILHKAKPTRLGPSIPRRVIGALTHDTADGMLAFLEALAPTVLPPVLTSSDVPAVIAAYSAYSEGPEKLARRVLVLVAATAKIMSKTHTQNTSQTDAAVIAREIEARLLKFSGMSHVIAHAIVFALGRLDPGPDVRGLRSPDQQPGWCRRVMDACDQKLFAYAMSSDSISDDDATARLFAVSETLVAVNAVTPQRLATVVQALTADKLAPSPGTSESRTVPTVVRAHALVALGKMCLLDATLAKQVVPSLARQLVVDDTSESVPILRNNAVVVLADLCMRHTALVDPYVPSITACFGDSSKLVRRQTITLVTRLILQDYVRWKGTLFFRFAFTLADTDAAIRDFANSCLLGVLRPKWPRALPTMLVEMIFVLNNYTGHDVFNQFDSREDDGTAETQSDALRARFALSGPENRQRRMNVYEQLLQEMPDDQRFQTCAKLAEDVLAAATDGTLPAGVSLGVDSVETDAASAVLSDALCILASPASHLDAVPDADDDATDKDSALLRARGKLLTNVLKKHMTDSIIPIVAALRRGMQTHRSPLLRELDLYLRVLVSQWRTEVVDALTGTGDIGLLAEIEAEMAQDKRREQELRRESIVPGSTPTAREVAVAKGSTPRLRRTVSRPTADSPPSTALPHNTPLPSPLPVRVLPSKATPRKSDAIHLYPPTDDLPPPRPWDVSTPVVSRTARRKRRAERQEERERTKPRVPQPDFDV